MNHLSLQVFDKVAQFLRSLPDKEQLKIVSSIQSVLEGDFETVFIKTLRGPIKELIIRRTRILFCVENKTLYVLHAFVKKTMRTPKRDLDYVERLFSRLLREIGPNK